MSKKNRGKEKNIQIEECPQCGENEWHVNWDNEAQCLCCGYTEKREWNEQREKVASFSISISLRMIECPFCDHSQMLPAGIDDEPNFPDTTIHDSFLLECDECGHCIRIRVR